MTINNSPITWIRIRTNSKDTAGTLGPATAEVWFGDNYLAFILIKGSSGEYVWRPPIILYQQNDSSTPLCAAYGPAIDHAVLELEKFQAHLKTLYHPVPWGATFDFCMATKTVRAA